MTLYHGKTQDRGRFNLTNVFFPHGDPDFFDRVKMKLTVRDVFDETTTNTMDVVVHDSAFTALDFLRLIRGLFSPQELYLTCV